MMVMVRLMMMNMMMMMRSVVMMLMISTDASLPVEYGIMTKTNTMYRNFLIMTFIVT